MIRPMAIHLGIDPKALASLLSICFNGKSRLRERHVTCVKHVTIVRLRYTAFSQENDIETRPRASKLRANGAHPSLGAVSPNGISQFFPRNKSNTTRKVVCKRVIFICIPGKDYERDVTVL